LRLARERGFKAVLGNHEEWHLRWRRHEDRCKADPKYVNPMTPHGPASEILNKQLSEEDLAWMRDLALIHESQGWVAVHGGFYPGIRPQDQNKDVVRIRWLSRTTHKHIPVVYKPGWTPPEDATHWSQLWDQPQNVVYGHEAHSLSKVTVVDSKNAGCVIGIDTGCVHGGRLSALVVEEDDFTLVQVEAQKQYFEPPFLVPV
jgi:hypothetical protein